MEIQTGRVAYYFQNIEALEVFVRLHQKNIVDTEEMIRCYKTYNMQCFDFYEWKNGTLTWSCNDKYEYMEVGYNIIQYVCQRSE